MSPEEEMSQATLPAVDPRREMLKDAVRKIAERAIQSGVTQNLPKGTRHISQLMLEVLGKIPLPVRDEAWRKA